MTAPVTYLVHGLQVRCRVPLRAAVAPGPCGPADVVLHVTEGDVPPGAPGGDRILAHVHDPVAARHWTLSSGPAGHTFLAHGALVARISPAQPAVVVTMARGLPDSTRAVLLGGPLLTACSLLRGRPLLHASAVVLSAGAVAFAGPSGAGKSTLARLLADLGHPLLSDDALRVDLIGAGPTAYPGTLGSRLRRGPASTARTAAGDDERHTVIGSDAPPHAVPLVGIVRPRLSSAHREVRGVRARPVESVLSVASVHALEGLNDVALLAEHFQHVVAVAQRVPVVHLDVPWSADPTSPVAPGLAEDVARVLTDLLEGTMSRA